jgi:hypothetical protein
VKHIINGIAPFNLQSDTIALFFAKREKEWLNHHSYIIILLQFLF